MLTMSYGGSHLGFPIKKMTEIWKVYIGQTPSDGKTAHMTLLPLRWARKNTGTCTKWGF
jgi:hypothetical protein